MKWTDEDIDKLFQDAAGKADVPYQESYWEEIDRKSVVRERV